MSRDDTRTWAGRRALAARLAELRTHARPRTGTVTAATAKTCSVDFGHGAATAVPLPFLAHYAPRVGDVVLIDWITDLTGVVVGRFA